MQPDLQTGRVLLVGAGPGPADLLTLRALRAIEGAGALLYDALVDETVVALAPAGCVRIQTGKRAGRARLFQKRDQAMVAARVPPPIEAKPLTGYDLGRHMRLCQGSRKPDTGMA